MNDRPKRIKLENFEIEREQDSRCTSWVVLEWEPGDGFLGASAGDDSLRGHIRSGAEAAAQALEIASEGLVDLDVLAVKAIEGFDTVLVIVAIKSGPAEINERVSGSCLMRGEPPKSAAMAVLDATNRLYGHALETSRTNLRMLH
jgi:hypothetical protein